MVQAQVPSLGGTQSSSCPGAWTLLAPGLPFLLQPAKLQLSCNQFLSVAQPKIQDDCTGDTGLRLRHPGEMGLRVPQACLCPLMLAKGSVWLAGFRSCPMAPW